MGALVLLTLFLVLLVLIAAEAFEGLAAWPPVRRRLVDLVCVLIGVALAARRTLRF